MPATRKDLVVDQGATFKLGLTYLDSNHNPVNLTNHTARLDVVNSQNEVLYTTDALIDPAYGYMFFKFDDEETALWTAGTPSYRVDLTNAAGDVDRLLFGKFSIRSGIV